jgi:hypothetical protein
MKDQETTLQETTLCKSYRCYARTPSESGQPKNYKEMKEKADNLDRLVDLMKNK